MRKKITFTLVAPLALAAMAAGPALTATAGTHAATSKAPKAWTFVKAASSVNDLDSITNSPGGSVWAAGNLAKGPVVQHLTAKGWQTVAKPPVVKGDAIDAAAANDVWVFGGQKAARWDGKKWISVKALPKGAGVTDADVRTTKDVWTVQDQSEYARHWNGKKWTSSRLPGNARSIAAVSAKNVWAVGDHHKGRQGALMHWTGKSWKTVVVPGLTYGSTEYSNMYDVRALSAKNIWVAGAIERECGTDGDDICARPVVLHYDGRKWTSSVAKKDVTSYVAVTSDNAGGVWLGGKDGRLVHLVGKTATTLKSPFSGGNAGVIGLGSSAKTAWAIGQFGDDEVVAPAYAHSN